MTEAAPARPISTAARAFEMTTVSTIGLPTTGPEPAAAILSPAEAGAAIRALAAADKIALMKIARLYAKKTPYDHEDLLQEAMCRVLSGVRAWPRDLAALPFLWGVVRSIAWEWRNETPDAMPDGADPAGEERRAIAGLDRHAEPDMAAAVRRTCPDGVDVLFDNVGNTLVDPVLPLMRQNGRIVVSGQTADYQKSFATWRAAVMY